MSQHSGYIRVLSKYVFVLQNSEEMRFDLCAFWSGKEQLQWIAVKLHNVSAFCYYFAFTLCVNAS